MATSSQNIHIINIPNPTTINAETVSVAGEGLSRKTKQESLYGNTMTWLVVEPTHLKNISQNGKSSPNRGENKQKLKPPPE